MSSAAKPPIEDKCPYATDPTELHKFLLKHEVGLNWDFNLHLNADGSVRKYDDYCEHCFSTAACFSKTQGDHAVYMHGVWVWLIKRQVIEA